ncbi:DUF1365 domain-containing protein [Williamsia sp. 1135]|uniref:DUF1365 domain-containing protein n=1 Tax=Williamsia sp. 1135 TaxID=1889262 RepID=UPI000A0F4D94|nr:DUF1365 domain-containing protein [Williamsia sp. 1135]ORM31878.1 hypothetical protein BFL43_17590 [Williamsia sp. 1135]
MSPQSTSPPTPALVQGRVRHLRRTPLEYGFDHRVYQWLVDLDEPPRVPAALRPFARLYAADHLGEAGPDAERTDPLAQQLRIKANVESFLAQRDVELGAGGRILMLSNARVLGYVFDPLTVFWCYAGTELRCVVAEVHNTYGERTAYLLEPEPDRAALHSRVPKHFYVSPFNDVSGDYDIDVRLDTDRVFVSISLLREGAKMFTASFDGRARAYTPRLLGHLLITNPLMPQRVTALIAFHGVWLWLRRLPVRARPAHIPPEGV